MFHCDILFIDLARFQYMPGVQKLPTLLRKNEVNVRILCSFYHKIIHHRRCKDGQTSTNKS